MLKENNSRIVKLPYPDWRNWIKYDWIHSLDVPWSFCFHHYPPITFHIQSQHWIHDQSKTHASSSSDIHAISCYNAIAWKIAFSDQSNFPFIVIATHPPIRNAQIIIYVWCALPFLGWNSLRLAPPVISIGIENEAWTVGEGKVKNEAKDEHDSNSSELKPSCWSRPFVVIRKGDKN